MILLAIRRRENTMFGKMDRSQLIRQLKTKIISTLNLPDIAPEDIADDAALFEPDGLGLDSVDALELVVMIEKDFGITVDDKDEAKTIFSSVGALADFITEKQK